MPAVRQKLHLSSCADFRDRLSGSGAVMSVSNGSALTSPNSNGTNNLIMSCGPPYYVEITKTGGGTFTLNSIDLAISSFDSLPTDGITINGSPLTITQTLTTYNFDLENVSSVDITGLASTITGYWTADNITYDEPVATPVSALCCRKRA